MTMTKHPGVAREKFKVNDPVTTSQTALNRGVFSRVRTGIVRGFGHPTANPWRVRVQIDGCKSVAWYHMNCWDVSAAIPDRRTA